MKDAKVDSKKTVKATKPRRVDGVPIRSGVKAGRHFGEGPSHHHPDRDESW